MRCAGHLCFHSTELPHTAASAAVSDVRVTVKCPFIRTYVERHPQYAAIATPPRSRPG